MQNTIEVSVAFSYQGKDYQPSIQINLDEYIGKGIDNEPFHQSLYQILAKANNIDTYSYLYEVMLQSDIVYQNAQGLAAGYLQQQQFDIQGFVKQLSSMQLLEKLQNLINREMIESKLSNSYLLETDLSKNQALKNVLIETYKLGQKESS